MSDLDHAIAELKRFRLHVARQLARLDGELLEYARASYRRAEKTHERCNGRRRRRQQNEKLRAPTMGGFALPQLSDIRRDPPRKLSLIWRRGRRSNGGPRVVRLLIGDIFGRCF